MYLGFVCIGSLLCVSGFVCTGTLLCVSGFCLY